MSTLTELPVEILLDNLLPVLPVHDLLSLRATSRHLATLCDDDTFWKKKCKDDFNFTGSRTARNSGWKSVYKGLSNPQVYVWGKAGQGRLGVSRLQRTVAGGIPYPINLKFPGRRIVDLVAGGWSFHALDSKGNVFVWGTLDGEMFALQSDGFSISSKIAETPMQLQLPECVRTLSCGRKHSVAFDAKAQIWTFVSWGRPFRLLTPLLDRTSPEAIPVQVECGWGYVAALTLTGDVYVWWPFGQDIMQQYAVQMARMDEEGDKRAHATSEGLIPCATWDLHYDPLRLPYIPRLPDMSHRNLDDDADETKLIKIAAMDGFLVGLTNRGHVLKFGDLSNPSALQLGQWEYLPFFSETEKIRTNPSFNSSIHSEEAVQSSELPPPLEVQITHITAHFERFVAYSTGESSIVLRGGNETRAEDMAEVIPELQYKSVISVVIGDYHNAALTADGKLYTWGAFSGGALGLGVPKDLPVGAPGGYQTVDQMNRARQGWNVPVPDVQKPTEVRFDHGDKEESQKFCFAATAAGWHTGALVIDLSSKAEIQPEVDSDDQGNEPTRRMPGHLSSEEPFSQFGPGQIPLHRGHAPLAPFRIGFAGRGLANRGRGGDNH